MQSLLPLLMLPFRLFRQDPDINPRIVPDGTSRSFFLATPSFSRRVVAPNFLDASATRSAGESASWRTVFFFQFHACLLKIHFSHAPPPPEQPSQS
jgi:hypothetical protein